MPPSHFSIRSRRPSSIFTPACNALLFLAASLLSPPLQAATVTERPCASSLSPGSSGAEAANPIISYFRNQRENAGKKAVFLFAIGGGNDTFSAAIPMLLLKEMGYAVHGYGVLSVTAHHAQSAEGLNGVEPPFLQPTTGFSRQLLIRPAKPIKNVERLLPLFLAPLPQSPDSMTLLSSKYTPAQMVPLLEKHIREKLSESGLTPAEALIVIADFGADVLSQGEPTTISPDLDATVLQFTTQLSAAFEKVAWLFWPGVDGELSPSVLRAKLEGLTPATLARSTLEIRQEWIDAFAQSFFSTIAPVRSGNTIPLALEFLRQGQPPHAEGLKIAFLEKKTSLGSTHLVKRFPIELDPELVRTSVLLDAQALARHNPFAQIIYKDQLEYFLKIKSIYRNFSSQGGSDGAYLPQMGSDFLLQYLRLDQEGLWSSRDPQGPAILSILVTPESYSETELVQVFTAGLGMLAAGATDIALLDRLQVDRSGFLEWLETKASLGELRVRSTQHYFLVSRVDSQELLDRTCQRVHREEQ